MIILRILLFPFAILYDAVTRFRNHLFDLGNKPSFEFDTNVIAVGNLSVGGTGKTPMIEYLIRLLSKQYKLTTLSRGYGRKTKGFRIANGSDSPKSLGDEPFQLFNKFKDVHVAVGEERALAIPEIIHNVEGNELILLDDAYQHRYVKPNLNILLTDYSEPFYNDFVLPSGRLREARKGADRADIVIVTKCPDALNDQKMLEVSSQITRYSRKNVPIFFSKVLYADPIAITKNTIWNENIILFTGLANNNSIVNYIDQKYTLIDTLTFSDHHNYTESDFNKLKSVYESNKPCILLTTEKDMVKLISPEIKVKIDSLPLFYLPIKTEFLKNGEVFDELVLNSIERNR